MSLGISAAALALPQADLVRGEFALKLRPDGMVLAPDLAEPLVPMLRALGGDPALWQEQPCSARDAVLAACRRIPVPSWACPDEVPTLELWRLHDDALTELDRARGLREPPSPNLLDLKRILAFRLLSPCRLCGRFCPVDRRVARGFCGLGDRLEVGAHAMLYNEGPHVGAPSFGVLLRGCALRCPSCYRPGEQSGTGVESDEPSALARLLDAAADAGARSWHFLGGNPDESLPLVLSALQLTTRECPVVWNSALTGSAETLRLLKGVVDVWVVDLKVAREECARALGAFEGYADWIRCRALELADQPRVVVRHLVTPGHAVCCTQPVRRFVRDKLPSHFTYVESPLHGRGGART